MKSQDKVINIAEIPNMDFSMLEYKFNEDEKYIYKIAGCLDNFYEKNFYFDTQNLINSF